MSMLFEGSGLSTALWITIRATALLGLTAFVLGIFSRRMSAASRHFLWTLAIVSVLMLPVASVALPEWSVVIRTAQPVASAAADVTPAVELIEPAGPPIPTAAFPIAVEAAHAVPDASEAPWLTVLLATYAGGVLVMLIHVMAGQRNLRRFVRSAAPMNDTEWVRLLADCARRMNVQRPVPLLRSRERSVPIALGTLRPSIVVPAIADTWDDDRRQAVLMHELAHVGRYDCLTQLLAVAACTMYWFHPFAWLAARCLRVERELACDDRVIQCGAEGRDYAGHLLEIAYSFGSYRAPALAVGMARLNQLEGRMLAAIDPRRNRNVPALRVRLASVALASAVLFTFASVRPTTAAAEPQTASPASGSVPQPDRVAPTPYSVAEPAAGHHRTVGRRSAPPVPPCGGGHPKRASQSAWYLGDPSGQGGRHGASPPHRAQFLFQHQYPDRSIAGIDGRTAVRAGWTR